MAKEIFDFYDRTSLKSYNLDKSMQYQLNILGSLDVFTRQHSENVASIVCRICQYLRCSKSFTEYCTICAYLHDIGKQFIPASILQKNGPLTDEEYEIMKTHTSIGHKICMNDLKLRPYAAGTIYHHESLNGTGYPNALVKNEIPSEGQIIRVADEYDAIVSKRQYKSHIGIVDTLKILIDECKPIENPQNYRVPVKDVKVGKTNPIIVKALIKVVIDDTEYEISCVMDYIKDLKPEIKRLEEVEKYDKKRLSARSERKYNYYLSGMKSLLMGEETVDNYIEILNSYRNIVASKDDHIKKLFEEIKTIKKLKL
ncbi:MAG: HD domain-containing protein [Clostridia bacterium]|nr:HD domain-containing protein [Clostridia bacterium]